MKTIKIKNGKQMQVDKAAKTIASGIMKVQNRFAIILQRTTTKWRQKHQWIFLYTLCSVFGILSILAIIQPFKAGETDKIIVIKSIMVPKSIYKENRAFLITEKEFREVQEYKDKYPDLKKTSPGLYDSLCLIEENYYSQQK